MNDLTPSTHNILARPHIRGMHSIKGDKTRMSVVTQCPHCRHRQAIVVPIDGAAAWERGAVIQYALPDLTTSEREALMSGICDPCWERVTS